MSVFTSNAENKTARIRTDNNVGADKVVVAAENPWGLVGKDRVLLKGIGGTFRQVARVEIAAWEVSPSNRDNVLSSKWSGSADQPIHISRLGAMRHLMLKTSKTTWGILGIAVLAMAGTYLNAKAKAPQGHLSLMDWALIGIGAAVPLLTWIFKDLLK